jgi:hypothetical protein
MYTLDDLYDRLDTGTAVTKRTGAFTEPSGDPAAQGRTIDDNREAFLLAMQERIKATDLATAADRTGGRYVNGRLTLKILGNDFSVDGQGSFYADIHVNPWVADPFFDCVLNGQGVVPSGQWVSFRELKAGNQRYALFRKRCEEAMQRVADQ